jgi:signal transduction histidine kinase
MNANAQLREEERPFDSAVLMAGIDVCPAGLAVVESGRILYANRAFRKSNGFASSPELRGLLLTDLLPRGTRYVDSWETQSGVDNGPIQIEAATSDFLADHRAYQVVCIRPVPQRTRSGVPLWDSQKRETIDRSTPGIAHDFGNLLTGILVYSDLLIAGLDAGSRLRRHSEAIRRSGTDGVRLIQQLMDPSQKEAAAIQPLSLNQLISEMASLLTRLVGDNIKIESKLDESAGLVKMDASQAQQIILNLVLNASDAMPKGGKITLSTRNWTARFPIFGKETSRAMPCVEFVVTDTGAGMDKKNLAQVFRPFFTTKTRSRGTGLGLTLVRSVVQKCGGQVEIESELGKGTQVTIRMPRIEVSGESN